MIKTLIQFETGNWLLKRSTLGLLLLWAMILLFALSNGSSAVEARQARFDSLAVLQNERLTKHPVLMDSFATGKKVAGVYWDDARNAYDIGAFFGKKYVFKPNQALAPLAVGQSNLHHADHELTTSAEFWFSALRKAERMDNPTNLIYGTFDLAFVLVWLFPLLVVAMNYNVLSAEREQGTLKMLLSHGVSIRSLLLTRIGFRFLIVFGITGIVISIGLMADGRGMDLAGFGMFLLLALLYGMLWHGLALWINLFNRSSNYNAGLLFTFWIAGVMVMPSLLNVIVTTITPIPGKVVLIDEVRERLTENDRKNSEILDQFYTDHPEFVIRDSAKLMPVFMYKYMVKEMTTSEQLQPVMDDYKHRLEAQSNTINALAVLIPSMAYQEALEEISGNSLSQYLAFQRFADQASRDWRNYFHPASLANKYLTVDEFRDLPEPSFTTPLNNGKTMLLLASLAAWNLVVLISAFLKLRRYRLA